MENGLMWYVIAGLITWVIGLYRELNKKTVGEADPMLVLAIIFAWPLFIGLLLYGKVKLLLNRKNI